MPRLNEVPEELKQYVKKGTFCDDVLEASKVQKGLFGCCLKPFDTNQKPFAQLASSCCPAAQGTVLAICVSNNCDMLVSGQHQCSKCWHFMCNFCCPAEEVFICKDCQETEKTSHQVFGAQNPTANEITAPAEPNQNEQKVGHSEATSNKTVSFDNGDETGLPSEEEVAKPGFSPVSRSVQPVNIQLEVGDLAAGDLIVTSINSKVHQLCQVISYDPSSPTKLKVYLGDPEDHALSCVNRATSKEVYVNIADSYFPTQIPIKKTQQAWDYGLLGFTYCDHDAFFRHEQKRGRRLDLHFMCKVRIRIRIDVRIFFCRYLEENTDMIILLILMILLRR